MAGPVCITENNMSLCTGCMVCLDICPVGAITESFTKDGFRVPVVCKDKCVKCGKCANVCSLNGEKSVSFPAAVYRMAAKDDNVRMMCSSGGIFFLLSEKVIKNGRAVIGVAFDAEQKDVCHVTSDECSMEEICRSKYVQSNTCGIYKKTEQILNTGRDVLFCGTPCQVRALRNFLKGKKYTGTVLTIDFMCHGVPATMEFKDFIQEREQKEKSPVINVTFREKDNGWRKQIIKAYHANGMVWEKTSYYYYYYYMFLKNYSLRDSCYSCKEYHAHTADLTLADDWSGTRNDNIGISRVFVNTPFGQRAVEEIAESVNQSDITADVISTFEIYSHAGYDYKKKELWKKALETGGYKKAKTELYLKASAVPMVKEKMWGAVSSMKNVARNLRGVNSTLYRRIFVYPIGIIKSEFIETTLIQIHSAGELCLLTRLWLQVEPV